MQESKPNLILTFAHGYAWQDLAVFFNSLRESGFKGDVVVFASRLAPGTADKLRENGAIVREVMLPLVKLRNVLLLPGWRQWRWFLDLLPSFATKRSVAKRVFNIMCARFACFHEYLEHNISSYDKVLVTDIRDVCFQTNPFEALDDGSILSFLEPLRLEGGANGKWMKEAFGAGTDPTLLREWVCCAGVTLGSAPLMFDYLTRMLQFLFKVELMTPVAGVDQAVHNFLFHRGALSGSGTMANGNPHCMTMGHGDPFQQDEGQRVLSSDERVVAILHQYDRHPDLKRIINERFG